MIIPLVRVAPRWACPFWRAWYFATGQAVRVVPPNCWTDTGIRL